MSGSAKATALKGPELACIFGFKKVYTHQPVGSMHFRFCTAAIATKSMCYSSWPASGHCQRGVLAWAGLLQQIRRTTGPHHPLLQVQIGLSWNYNAITPGEVDAELTPEVVAAQGVVANGRRLLQEPQDIRAPSVRVSMWVTSCVSIHLLLQCDLCGGVWWKLHWMHACPPTRAIRGAIRANFFFTSFHTSLLSSVWWRGVPLPWLKAVIPWGQTSLPCVG